MQLPSYSGESLISSLFNPLRSKILCGCVSVILAGGLIHAQDYQATAPVGFQGTGANAKLITSEVSSSDVDGDGWDDLWLNLYGRVVDLKADPNGDYDQDGVSNIQEMRDFTNPLVKDRDPKTPLAAGSAATRRQAIIDGARVEPLKDIKGKEARFKDHMRKVEQDSHALSAQLRKIQEDQRARALTKAKALGLASEGATPDGGYFSITDFDGEIPQRLRTDGSLDANLIGTDQLWPGGVLGYSLTGTGSTIGLWDGGIPLSSHQEFNDSTGTGTTRITIADGSTTVAPHATGTAGVLANTGLYTDAIGMSYQANVNASDFLLDLSEMSALPLAAQRVNNHSYNKDTGWGGISFTGIPRVYRMWWGDIAISTAESHNFGRYDTTSAQTDQVVRNLPYTLPVWSAGNDRGEAPDNDTVVINGTPGYFLTSRNGSLVFFNGAQYWPSNGNLSYNATTQVSTFTPAAGVTPVSQSATIGNDGGATGYDTLPIGYATGKNNLVVGAIDENFALYPRSSFGPTDDGRMKPEIVAIGVGVVSSHSASTADYANWTGTSFSAPGVAGSLNLLAQHQENFWGPKEPFLASTLRALAAHTAVDLLTTGPDYRTGYGRLDTAAAAAQIESNFYSGARSFIKEVLVPNNGEVEFPVKAAGAVPIRVTIAWTDPAGTAQTATLDPGNSVLVNNLDVRVYRTSPTPVVEYFPWTLNPASPATAAVRNVTNDRDNLEQVLTPNATTNSLYSVKIKQKAGTSLSGGSQLVSIIVGGITPLPKPTFQVTNISLDASSSPGSIRASLTWNSVVGQWYRIQKSANPGGPWVDDSGDINAIKETSTAYSNYTTPIPSSQFWRVIEVPPNPFGLP